MNVPTLQKRLQMFSSMKLPDFVINDYVWEYKKSSNSVPAFCKLRSISSIALTTAQISRAWTRGNGYNVS